jgi:hypothetical protein
MKIQKKNKIPGMFIWDAFDNRIHPLKKTLNNKYIIRKESVKFYVA